MLSIQAFIHLNAVTSSNDLIDASFSILDCVGRPWQLAKCFSESLPTCNFTENYTIDSDVFGECYILVVAILPKKHNHSVPIISIGAYCSYPNNI